MDSVVAPAPLNAARWRRGAPLRSWFAAVCLASLFARPGVAAAVTVSWAVDTSGFWDAGANWSTGIVPQPGDDVVIDRPSANVTVTHRFGTTSGVTAINSLTATDNVVLSGGTLTVASASSLATFTLSGGVLNGAGTVTINGALLWSAGTMGGTGVTNANGGIDLTNTGSVAIHDTRVVNNAGTTMWTGSGGFSNDPGAVFNNLPGATFNIQTIGDLFNGTFNNAGTLTKTAGGGDGITRLNAPVNNTGTVTVSSGVLELDNGGSHSGTFTVAGGAILELGGGIHTVSNPAMFSGAGRVRFASGTTNFNAGTYNITGTTDCQFGTHTFAAAATVTAIGALDISGGTLTFDSGEALTAPTGTLSAGALGGADTLTINGLLTWSGGTMRGSGVTNANGGIQLGGSSTVSLRDTRTLNSAGTTTWTGTNSFSNDPGALFNNLPGATFNIQTIGDFFNGTFNNAGTLTKIAGGGDGITRISGALNNTGMVMVTSGSLELDFGGLHSGGFAVTGGGILELGGGTHSMNAGTSVVGDGRLRFAGGTTNFNAGSYNVTGVTECQSGSHTFAAAVTVTAVGALEISAGTLTFNSGEPLAASTYMQSAGTFTGSDALTVSGLLTWSAGTMAGPGVTNANGGIAIGGASTVSLRDTRTLNSAGTTTWTGTSSFSNDTGAVFNNLPGAAFNIQTTGDIFGGTFNNAGTLTKVAGGGDTITRVSATFNNSGAVAVTSGILELDGGGNHSGSFTIAADGIFELGGGTHTLSGGSISGAGRMRLGGGTTNVNGGTYDIGGVTESPSGTHTFAAGATVVAVGALALTGGTLVFNSGESIIAPLCTLSGGTLAGSDTVTVTGLLTWSAGAMAGSGVTNANGGIQLAPTTTVFLRDTRTVNNAGTATWTGVGNLAGEVGNVFNNLDGAVFDIQTPGDVLNARFNNAGTFTKAAGGGDGITRISGPCTNTGSVEVSSGSLRLENAYSQTAGVTRLNGGNITTTTLLDIQSGLLAGFGTITGNVDSAGAVAPGLSPGLLNIPAPIASATTGPSTSRSAGSPRERSSISWPSPEPPPWPER